MQGSDGRELVSPSTFAQHSHDRGDEDLARARRRLQALSLDDGEPEAVRGVNGHVAGGDADPDRERFGPLSLAVVQVDFFFYSHCGRDSVCGAFEGGHDPIPGVFYDASPGPEHGGADQAVVALTEALGFVLSQSGANACRIDQVGEQHRQCLHRGWRERHLPAGSALSLDEPATGATSPGGALRQGFWGNREPFLAGSLVEPAVPGGQHEIVRRQGQGGGQVEGVEAAEIPGQGQLRCPLDQSLVDLHHAECPPLLAYRSSGRVAGGDPYGSNHLHEGDPADEPSVGCVHHLAYQVAPRLLDVALDEGAGVQIQVQRSASRSDRTTWDAERVALASRGARGGRARDGSERRPCTTSWRSRSSGATAPAGTMSATALPRLVTRTCSPRPTDRRTSDSDAFSSRIPISLMWPQYRICGHDRTRSGHERSRIGQDPVGWARTRKWP